VNGKQEKLYSWKGDKACDTTLQRSQEAVQNLKERLVVVFLTD